MANQVTLEQVEQLAAQLPPPERLKLVARICECLIPERGIVISAAEEEEQARQERLAKVDAWVAECERVAELWEGEFDSAADLRRIRHEEE
jgi:hypothetical protein